MAQLNNYSPVEARTNDGWVVVCRPSPWSDTQELWIGKVESNGKFYRGEVQEDGYLKLIETQEGSEMSTPTLRINRRAWEGFAEALRGVTPAIDKKEVDAELKATKYHLEDMRKLALSVKKMKK